MPPARQRTVTPFGSGVATGYPADMATRTSVATLFLAAMLTACAQARVQAPGPGAATPAIGGDHVVTADGVRLPLARWEARGETRRVVLALHGFNDFRRGQRPLAEWLRLAGTTVYAYDQRGFGATARRGIWPGGTRLVDDAVTVIRLLRKRYPGRPVYVYGESMGAAVAVLALARDEAPTVDGAILSAPAVWHRDLQPWYQRLGLWLGEHVTPGWQLDTSWADVDPSDDPDVLAYWRRHPQVIREPRADTLAGLTDLMSRALESAADFDTPALILYGGNDEVIPPAAVCALLERLPPPDETGWRFAFYPDGYHFLARDTRSEATLADITAWLANRNAELPSGHELPAGRARETVCGPV